MRVLKRIWSYQEFVPTLEPIYEYHNSLVLLDYYGGDSLLDSSKV